MIRRFWSAILVLCFVVVGVVAVTPPVATATTTWPITVDGFAPNNIQAYEGGSFAAIACRSELPTDPNARYYSSSGESRSSLPGSGSSNGTYCREDAGYGAGDGTLYGWRNTPGNTTQLVAWKNNRQLWTTDISSPVKCNQYGSYSDKEMTPTSISEGSDGRIFMVLVPNGSFRACDDRLVGLDPQTGVISFDAALGTGPAGGSGLGYAPPTAWTYASDIIVIDRSGVVRTFGYDGVENTAAAFQMPIPSGHIIDKVAANDAGTVFAATSPTWVSGQVHLLYRTRSGNDGDITDTSAGAVVLQLQATNDGNVVATWGNPARTDHFDINTDTVSSTYPTPLTTTGYSNYALQAYLQDEAGNEVWMWSHWDDTSGNQGVSVEVFDATLSSTSVAFLKEKKPADTSNYPEFFERSGGFIRDAIANGTLYLATCPHDSTTCYGNPGSASMNIHKIDVGPFGTALGKGFARNAYDSQKLEYVAMGDSFSSGEGVEPFLPGTDRADDTGTTSVNEENRCHRSEDAYPMLLEEDTSLNLDLTAFVACSGATTSNITGTGQWGEPRQLDALSETTDVVTITIGGNDVGFADAMFSCTLTNPMPEGWTEGQEAYDRYKCVQALGRSQSIINGYTLLDGQTFKSRYESMLTSILGKVGDDAIVKILGYPNLFPDYDEMYTVGCDWGYNALGWGETSGRLVHEEEVGLIRQVAGELSATINTAVSQVNDSRLHFEDVRASFTNHEICGSQLSFMYHINTVVQKGSYHPNSRGQEEYRSTVHDLITN